MSRLLIAALVALMMLMALVVFTALMPRPAAAAQPPENYGCLPVQEADAWHRERGHELTGGFEFAQGWGFTWTAPDGSLYRVFLSRGMIACIVAIEPGPTF